MQELEKNIEEIKSGLFSGDVCVINDTLAFIRELHEFQYIEILFDLYVTTQNKEVKTSIFNLLVDIKDERFVESIVECIQKPKYGTVINDMIAVCWQTGLDFSKHTNLFLDLFLTGDLHTAIECFTVIEEALPGITEKERGALVERINASHNNASEEKKLLANELKSLLQ